MSNSNQAAASKGYGGGTVIPLNRGNSEEPFSGPSTPLNVNRQALGFPYETIKPYQSHPNSAQSFPEHGNNPSSAWSKVSSAASSSHSFVMEKSKDPNERHISVVCRIRPMNDLELERKDTKALIPLEDNQTLQVIIGDDTKPMTFHRVLGESSTQQMVFEESGVIDLLEKAMDGYSTTVFAFGQTSSGKTYTMTGPDVDGPMEPEAQGIIPRALHYLFHRVAVTHDIHYTIRAAYLEIYNEQVKDLLNSGSNKALPIRWKSEKGFYVENIFVVECEVLDDILAVLEEGLRNRKTGSHRLNEHSSRSHSIMTLYLDSETIDPEDNRLIRRNGKISFVDLAGSEKVKESKATGSTFTEMLNINKSLLTLGNCISALADSKRRTGHIPYRDSKLTKLLADSLGGSGIALMIACASPSSYNMNESLTTLRYASRAKNIKNRPVIQMDPREELIMQLKRENKVLRNENQVLRAITRNEDVDLSALTGVESIHLTNQIVTTTTKKSNSEKNANSMFPNLIKSGASNASGGAKDVDQAKELVTKYSKEVEAVRTENNELQQSKNKLEKECQEMALENERLIAKLERLERVFVEKGLSASIPWNESNNHKPANGSKPSQIPSKSANQNNNNNNHTSPKKATNAQPVAPAVATNSSTSLESNAPTVASVVHTKQKLQEELSILDEQINSLKQQSVAPPPSTENAKGKSKKK